jgi:TPR repeat protein
MDGRMQILHKKADEENDTKSQNILGGLYISGIGEEKPNEEKSLKYYLMAAENGDVDSMIFVSSLYQATRLLR